ncbi:lipopolysaccharide transport periplasmic protein LptA [Rickettsiella grylli]|uniref:Organic solvent tolerance-like N-terminal domain-containing protein n=1 Tax=Rickettsiella grylli TaxID=59196 RepID=A8PQ07_9COXI|nr:lipopolysaccharide transport periplasmic protein LptA [Rickettsiella grylli]EDP45696.1 conserved hypothetical protein [Rickettsiella grylli]OJA00182.1 lipopolysaccharide transport periplasmic protein LptA [Rickettsiella grylli]
MNALEQKIFKIKKAYLLFVNLSIVFCLSTVACAHSNDLAYFESDSVTYNNKTKQGIYRGHIKLTQGSAVLTADYATSYFDQNGQINKIIAIGNPARYQAFIFPHRPQLIATGKTIYYYPKKEYLEAIGNAEMVQGKNHFKGYQINYDFKTKTIGSPLSPKGHTQITIAPLNHE